MDADVQSLEELNDEEAKIYIGGAIFVGILMVVGFIGNIHVLYIFTFKTKPSNHRVFILCLAAIDMVTCCVGMPFVLIDLTHPLTFTMIAVCKILRFINYFMCSSSALVLVVIAVDRYRKICVPHGKQMTSFWAKVSVGIVLGISLLFSWPSFVLYGHNTVPTSVENITGVRCYTDDAYVDTKYMAYFNIVLITIAFGVFVVLSVVYIIIGRVILKHGAFKYSTKKGKERASDSAVHMGGFGTNSTTNPSSESREAVEISTKSKSTLLDQSSTQQRDTAKEKAMKPERPDSKNWHEQNDRKNAAVSTDHAKKQRERLVKSNSTRRMTFILFMITVVFFISFIPHLVLKIVTYLNKTFVSELSYAKLVVYNTFIWCFFINNVANPIIYGFCDVRFRAAVEDLYCGVFARLKCKQS